MLPPKKESKAKVSKFDAEVKEELDSVPQIIENKTNSYILLQVRFIFNFTHYYIHVIICSFQIVYRDL